MEAIATSAREQSVGLSEVNAAVNQMDQVTQQNAAMVEETTAASASLANEAANLRHLIAQFKLQGSAESTAKTGPMRQAFAPAPGPARSQRQSQSVSSPARKLVASLSSAFGSAAVANDSWEEF
jgi:methyl-accepting chemotaxis protein